MSPPPARSRLLPRLLRGVVALGLLTLIAHHVDVGAAAVAYRAAPWAAFVAPPLLLLINAAMQAQRLVWVCGATGAAVPYGLALRTVLRAVFVGLALPSGGADLAKLHWLGKASGAPTRVAAALLLMRIQEILPWLSLLLYGLSTGISEAWPLLGLAARLWSIAFVLALLALPLLARSPDLVGRRWPRLRALATDLAAARDLAMGAPRPLLGAQLLAFAVSMGNVTAAWVILRGMGAPLSWSAAAAIVPAADAVVSLPVTVSGVGLREGVLIHLFAAWGGAAEVAVAAGLLRFSAELVRASVGGVLFFVGDAVEWTSRAGPTPEPQPPARVGDGDA